MPYGSAGLACPLCAPPANGKRARSGHQRNRINARGAAGSTPSRLRNETGTDSSLRASMTGARSPAIRKGIASPQLGDGGTADRGEPSERDSHQRCAGHNEPPAADAIGEESGQRTDHQQHRRPWQGSNACLQRRVAPHELQELREQEDPNIPKNSSSEVALAAAKPRLLKYRMGIIGDGVLSSQSTNPGHRRG